LSDNLIKGRHPAFRARKSDLARFLPEVLYFYHLVKIPLNFKVIELTREVAGIWSLSYNGHHRESWSNRQRAAM
jgi:hypothetical protein